MCYREDQFTVNIGHKACTCRAWDLTGIPCIHACLVMTFLNLDPAELVVECYTVVKYLEAYRYGIEPLNGLKMWLTSEGYPVVPPIVRKMSGRPPKRKRKRLVSEKETGNSKVLPRFRMLMTCQQCFQVGHNKKTCKNTSVERLPKTNVRHWIFLALLKLSNFIISILLQVKLERPRKDATQAERGHVHVARKRNNASQNSTPNPKPQQQNITTTSREKRQMKTRYGVRSFEDTGNIYMMVLKAQL